MYNVVDISADARNLQSLLLAPKLLWPHKNSLYILVFAFPKIRHWLFDP
jgi:hypothetical protein